MAKNQDPASPIVTRFAPSPTGYLHIGGARTALFNWLYARGRGGKFLLRIEDTDRARHSPQAVTAILDGLSWLGVDWDGDPVSQYDRRARHLEVAKQLEASGHAYRCFLSPEEIETAREKALSEKTRFESPWRNASADDWPNDKPYVLRFRAPQEGQTSVRDDVQGEVNFPNSAFDDLILIRSDSAPTYNLAVVVDDHDMGVTHVIRGDDHLTNAGRQQQIYEALDWPVPIFGHVPLIHGQDGKKLSKRHGALGVEAYRDDGILRDALVNYLIRLGWAHGDAELISRDQAKEWFDLTGVNKAPARLDPDKLKNLNNQYINQLNDEDFLSQALPFLEQATSDETHARLKRGAGFLKERCESLRDINEQAAFLMLQRPFVITGKSAKPMKKEGAKELLSEIAEKFDDEDLWKSPQDLENFVKNFVEDRELGFGAIGAPMRAALTAGHPSPSLGEVLYSLGPAETLARLADVHRCD